MREYDAHQQAPTYAVLQQDVAAIPSYDGPGDGETEAGSACFPVSGFFQPEKRPKDTFSSGLCDAAPPFCAAGRRWKRGNDGKVFRPV